MKNARRMKLTLLVLSGALVFGACGAEAEVALPQGEEPAVTSSPDEAAESPAEVPEAAAPAEESADDTSAAPDVALITIDGEELSFDLYSCAALTPQFLGANGLPTGDAPPITEFSLLYQLPMLGDGDDAEYENFVNLQFGIDSWRAGTLESPSGDESWGQLDWNREGDVITGTAELVQVWPPDAEDTGPRSASFVVSCG